MIKTKPQVVHFDLISCKVTKRETFRDVPYIICREHAGKTETEHRHPQPEFWLIKRGTGKVKIGHSLYNVSSGDIVFINSLVGHSTDERNAEDLSYISITVSKPFIEECGISSTMLFEEVFKDEQIAKLLNDTFTLADKRPPYYDLKIKANLLSIGVMLLERHYIIDAGGHRPLTDASTDTAKAIIEYIEGCYLKPLPLSKISKTTHLSKCYICKIFKESTGDTILSYINNIRCIYAEFLLHTTNMTVTEIAKASGFGNASYFSRVFKKLYGYPPTAADRKKRRK